MNFWDREKEVKFFMSYFQTEPNAIVFAYGPKSSGKTSLFMQVISNLQKQIPDFPRKFQIFWFDLRGRMIVNYESVVDIFFMSDDSFQTVENVFKTQIGLKNFFLVEKQVKERIKLKEIDPFTYMEQVLVKNSDRGIRNIIIFDELQKLKEVYLNSPVNQRPVVNELFNFFVRLTKVLHTSHIIVMTSDTFFIDEVFRNSSLAVCSKYYLVDDPAPDEIKPHLLEEGLDEKEIKYIFRNTGTVPWRLTEIVMAKKQGISVKESIMGMKEELKGFTKDTINRLDSEEKRKKVIETLRKLVSERGRHIIGIGEDTDIYRFLTDIELCFYDPLKSEVRFRSPLELKAVKELLK